MILRIFAVYSTQLTTVTIIIRFRRKEKKKEQNFANCSSYVFDRINIYNFIVENLHSKTQVSPLTYNLLLKIREGTLRSSMFFSFAGTPTHTHTHTYIHTYILSMHTSHENDRACFMEASLIS